MTRPGRATFTRESAERIARAVRQVELGTPAARPLSFEAVLSQAARNRTTSDVRVAERRTTIVPPATSPTLDYSSWPTGAPKIVVLSGEFWDNPAAAFSGSGSLGSANYTKTASYPAQENQSCSFTVNVTDNRVPNPEAVPPQTAETYSIPVRIPGVGPNKEGILPMASISGASGWDVQTGTLTVTLSPGQSQTVTATGTCLQNGLGKQILAENVGARVEQFEVEPGPQYMVVRRDEDASPRWIAVALDPKDSAYGRFYGEWETDSYRQVVIRIVYGGAEPPVHTVTARNPGKKVGSELPGQYANQAASQLALTGAPSTACIVGRAANVPGVFGWVLLAPVSRPNVLRLNGTFAAPWQKGTTKTVNTSDTAFPSVPVSNGLGDVRGVGSRSCEIVGTENQNGGYDWSLVLADFGWSGIIQGTFTAPWPKNQSKQITVSFGNGSEEISVSNPYASIAGTAEKSCVVANLGTGGTDNWILIAAECS